MLLIIQKVLIIELVIRIGIKSINLTNRNEIVIKRFFNQKGNKGRFSSWVNKMMDQEFIIDEVEALKVRIKENKEQIIKLEDTNGKLVKKLEEKECLKDTKRFK